MIKWLWWRFRCEIGRPKPYRMYGYSICIWCEHIHGNLRSQGRPRDSWLDSRHG